MSVPVERTKSGFHQRRWVALSGGVGGAKLSLGLARILGDRLTVIVNTGDDFEHLGLHISPDVDTAIYTLAGLVNPETGWGRRDETWTFMSAIAQLGGPTWFKLGDADLGMHVERTHRLRAGESLTAFCADACRRFGIAACVIPMSDDRVRTVVDTDRGTLAFQEYFVREQCQPTVRSIRFHGAEGARPSAPVLAALADPELGGIVVCPSNPFLSIDPLLAIPGLRDAVLASGVPVIAVTPIIAGRAVKGPAAKIMRELGLEPDAVSISGHYRGLIDGFVLDACDTGQERQIGVPTLVVNTLMRTLDDKIELARACLGFCERLVARPGRAQAHARAKAGS
ncbi:MAG: 2-phospho-L-lactate transferase [Hyphomicrobiaceae bacterium]|nr:2-phospho-L-lactate transferase [Hyphomicrobiaceae bacterium]